MGYTRTTEHKVELNGGGTLKDLDHAISALASLVVGSNEEEIRKISYDFHNQVLKVVTVREIE